MAPPRSLIHAQDVLFSIAALASLAGAAIAQTPAPEPAWRKGALALVPAGYVGGDAYRTDETTMTGYLAVYPANASDPKSSGLPKAMAACAPCRPN